MTLAWAPGMGRPASPSKAELSCQRRRAADTRADARAKSSQGIRPDKLLLIGFMENLPRPDRATG